MRLFLQLQFHSQTNWNARVLQSNPSTPVRYTTRRTVSPFAPYFSSLQTSHLLKNPSVTLSLPYPNKKFRRRFVSYLTFGEFLSRSRASMSYPARSRESTFGRSRRTAVVGECRYLRLVSSLIRLELELNEIRPGVCGATSLTADWKSTLLQWVAISVQWGGVVVTCCVKRTLNHLLRILLLLTTDNRRSTWSAESRGLTETLLQSRWRKNHRYFW